MGADQGDEVAGGNGLVGEEADEERRGGGGAGGVGEEELWVRSLGVGTADEGADFRAQGAGTSGVDGSELDEVAHADTERVIFVVDAVECDGDGL